MSKEKDKISRKAFLHPDAAILSRLLKMDIVKAYPVPPHVRQTIEERETDTVLLVHTRQGKQFILHLEFQSSNDPKMVMRMAIYDMILHEEHELEVLGFVIYIGKEPLNMRNTLQFFNVHYSCPIIDIRDLDPQLFIESTNPRQVIYGVLAGPDNTDKMIIIQKILSRLQVQLAGSNLKLSECILELGYLAQTRNIDIQNLIKKEVVKMPITLPLEGSIFYQDIVQMAKEKGKLEGKWEDAERMFQFGLPIDTVHHYTGLDIGTLKKLQHKLLKRKK